MVFYKKRMKSDDPLVHLFNEGAGLECGFKVKATQAIFQSEPADRPGINISNPLPPGGETTQFLRSTEPSKTKVPANPPLLARAFKLPLVI